jgi:hypothetical protein
MRQAWTAAQDTTLRDLYPTCRAADLAVALGRSFKSVVGRAAQLGLSKAEKPWTEDDLATLREVYPAGDVRALAVALGRTATRVYAKASELGLVRTPAARPSRRNLLREALADAGVAGLNTDEARALLPALSALVVQRALRDLVDHGQAWCANPTGRQGRTRWFAQADWARAYAPALTDAEDWQAKQAAHVHRRAAERRETLARAAQPLVMTDRSLHQVLPAKPDHRYTATGPVPCIFGRPGEYLDGPARPWVQAATGARA